MNCNIQNYIDFVRSGEIEVCKKQLLLCDYVESIFQNEDIYVNTQQLEKYLDLQKYFPFRLFEWEKFCFTLHNCTYKLEGTLRFPDLLILVGRGAGKNGYLAFEDFCLLTPINGVEHFDIDICANNEEQAMTSFKDIYNVLEDNRSKLEKHFSWNKTVITNLRTKSQLKYRTSNAKTKDGGRPGKVDFDEYHQYENYESIEVFKTGLGKKQHPRQSITTTNGNVRDGPLDHIIARAEQILIGAVPDNGLLPFVCELDNIKEVSDPKKWAKANPSLPFNAVLRGQMEREYVDYLQDKVSNSSFMTKRMNIPQGKKDLEVTSWDNILATNKPMPPLENRVCVWGIDYANTDDFVAAGLLFKVGEIYYWITHTWVCMQGKDLSRVKIPFEEWAALGYLTMVDAVEINPDIPVLWLQEQCEKYNLVMGAIDKYRFTLMTRALEEAGFLVSIKNGNMKLVRPSDQMLISPTINSIFTTQRIVWGDNPLMRWYTNNAKRIVDPKGNVSYGKIEEKARKTDGFMALVAAMAVSGILDQYQSYEDMAGFDFSAKSY